MRAPTSPATEARKTELEALSAMQAACMRGEISEDDYNAHREVEGKRLVALGVLPGRLAAKVIKGEPTL